MKAFLRKFFYWLKRSYPIREAWDLAHRTL